MVLFVSFQNFVPANFISSPRYIPPFTDQAHQDLWRRRVWAKKCGPDQTWEICFEGQGVPGSNQRSHLEWDNPVDDDWDEVISRTTSWIINAQTPLGTVMRVDRTLDGHRHKTGHFWRRDELLTAATGLVAAFRVKILPHSGDHGVMFHFMDDRHAFTLEFGPQMINFYSTIAALTPVASQKRRNTSVTTFKLIKHPNSGIVELWAGDYRLFSRAVLQPGSNPYYSPINAERGFIASRIGFGDYNNASDNGQTGAYEVTYFRYRRADDRVLRKGPALPPQQICNSAPAWKRIHSQSTETFNTAIVRMTDVLPDVAPKKFGRSFKFSMKLDPNAKSTDGFSFDYYDRLGGVILTIYPERIELKANIKPVRPAVVIPPGFDGYNLNSYRLVRSANGLYWNLYLNENPVPVIVDVRSSGLYVPSPGLFWGPFKTPEFDELDPGVNTIARQPSRGYAYVPNIEWIDEALAPARCP